METILYLAHTESDGTLGKAAFEALGAAVELSRALGASLVAGLFGSQAQPAADSIANCGAQKFFTVEETDFASARYASDASACEALVKSANPTIIITAGTSRASRVMAGVAHRLGGRIDTHVSALMAEGGAVNVSRWFYRQRIEATLTRTQRPWIVLVDPGTNAAWEGVAGTATVEAIAVALPDSAKRTTVTGMVTPEADQQTIRPDAKLLFVAGAGWTKKQKDGQTHIPEAEVAILDFLKKSNASLGGSKSIVDLGGEGQSALGFMTHMNQIGQTGSTPRHAKGLSTCCHGEEPHVVGWRFIGERRAINLDANCGWARGKADVVYVADAFEVMKKLNELLA